MIEGQPSRNNHIIFFLLINQSSQADVVQFHNHYLSIRPSVAVVVIPQLPIVVG